MAAVSGQLDALREEAGHGSGAEYFCVRVLGGDWSAGRPTDIGSYPRDKEASLWSKAVGWPPSPGQKSFSVNKFGLVGARMLAEELTRKANHFMGGWTDAGAPSGFTFDVIAQTYQSPREYLDWWDTCTIGGPAFTAATVLRTMQPLPVPA